MRSCKRSLHSLKRLRGGRVHGGRQCTVVRHDAPA
jgi:hypothetical protein